MEAINRASLTARLALLAGACAVGVLIAILLAAAPASSATRARAVSGLSGRVLTTPGTQTADITAAAPQTGVAPTSTKQAFLGIATELNTITELSGTASDPDIPFVHLLRALSVGAPLLLRLGGNSTDNSWWPVRGHKQPDWIYRLTPQWGADVRKLINELGASAILGVNLEVFSKSIARAEVAGFERYIGPKLIDAFELGNEPEDWPSTNKAGQKYRVHNHYAAAIAAYSKEFRTIAGSLGKVPLAGPGSGSPHWIAQMNSVLSEVRAKLKLVTVHEYALTNCTHFKRMPPSSFFTKAALAGMATRVGAAVSAAHRHVEALRVGEMNGLTCGGQPGLSNSFSEALWALNVLPQLWRAGVAGVNFQTVVNYLKLGRGPGGNYNQMIAARQSAAGWRVSVEPEYYGLLAFAQAVPAGSRLLQTTSANLPQFFEFAVRTPSGSERIVLTNVGSAARTVGLSAPGTRGPASLSLLTAKSLSATGGVTLSGQSLSARTGRLAGKPSRTEVDANTAGVYGVTVPADSAVTVMLAGS